MIKNSERLSKMVTDWLKSRDKDDCEAEEALYDMADSTCTTGYDNDGSTGYEIFENGVGLGAHAGDRDIWCVRHPDALVAYFFVGTEDEVAARLSGLPS